MSSALKVDVAIVGAGIGGLALAYRLHRAGISALILEAQGSAGGCIRSERSGGFLLEHGPNSIIAKDELLRFIEELGLESRLLRSNPQAKNRYLAIPEADGDAGRLIAAPKRLHEALLSPALSVWGKLRIAGDLFSERSRQEDESVDSFFSRHLGRGVTEGIVAPMLSGIWAADITKLSTRCALPKVWKLEQAHRSLLIGAVKEQRARSMLKNRTRPALITFREGIAELVAALQQSLPPESILLDAPLERIMLEENGVRLFTGQGELKQIVANRVVVTAGARETAGFIRELSPNLSREIRLLPYAPLGVLHLGYRKREVAHPLEGFGFLAQPGLGLSLLGAIFASSLFEGRADPEHHLITCFVGGARSPDQSNVTRPALQEHVIQDIGRLIGAEAKPTVLGATWWQEAIPNYRVGHHLMQHELDEFERKFPAVKLLANWRRGISITDRIAEAEALAASLVSEIGELNTMSAERRQLHLS